MLCLHYQDSKLGGKGELKTPCFFDSQGKTRPQPWDQCLGALLCQPTPPGVWVMGEQEARALTEVLAPGNWTSDMCDIIVPVWDTCPPHPMGEPGLSLQAVIKHSLTSPELQIPSVHTLTHSHTQIHTHTCKHSDPCTLHIYMCSYLTHSNIYIHMLIHSLIYSPTYVVIHMQIYTLI